MFFVCDYCCGYLWETEIFGGWVWVIIHILWVPVEWVWVDYCSHRGLNYTTCFMKSIRAFCEQVTCGSNLCSSQINEPALSLNDMGTKKI